MKKHLSATHLPYLDGLRAVAALYVVLHHAGMQVEDKPNWQFLKIAQKLFVFGHYAVVVFIVLSGFCLMLPVVKNNGVLPRGPWSFIKRRAYRILPPYYLAVLLSLVFIATLIGTKTNTHWDVSIPVTTFDLLTHATLVQDIFSSSSPQNQSCSLVCFCRVANLSSVSYFTFFLGKVQCFTHNAINSNHFYACIFKSGFC